MYILEILVHVNITFSKQKYLCDLNQVIQCDPLIPQIEVT